MDNKQVAQSLLKIAKELTKDQSREAADSNIVLGNRIEDIAASLAITIRKSPDNSISIKRHITDLKKLLDTAQAKYA